MMKLPSSTNDEKRKRKMTSTSDKIRSSFSTQFTRVFGISSIIAIARSTDQTRFFLEAEAVNPIPSNTTYSEFKQLVSACLAEAGAAVTGECTTWGGSTTSPANNYGTIPNWNTSLVTDMESAFFGKSSFNGNISSWDTSSVMDMNGMFAEATAFNQPIEKWTTSSVTDMTYMFAQATAFNRPIEKWTTSSVMDMSFMFAQATAFNQAIGKWTTSSVTSMEYMFNDAATFDQDISTWTGTAANTTQDGMFDGATAFQAKYGSFCTNNITGPPSTCKVPLPPSSSSRSPRFTKAVALVGFISTIAPMLWF
jgi:surface protein